MKIEESFLIPCHYCRHCKELVENVEYGERGKAGPIPLCKAHVIFFLFLQLYGREQDTTVRLHDGSIDWFHDWAGEMHDYCPASQVLPDDKVISYSEAVWKESLGEGWTNKLRRGKNSVFYRDWFARS